AGNLRTDLYGEPGGGDVGCRRCRTSSRARSATDRPPEMIACDWRTLDATEMAPLYATETGRWLRELAWDSAPAWAAVELARTTWGLPGLVCVAVTGRGRRWNLLSHV